MILDDYKHINPLVLGYGVKRRRRINGGYFVYVRILLLIAYQIEIIVLKNLFMKNVKNRYPWK
jgi:hypothetical protein